MSLSQPVAKIVEESTNPLLAIHSSWGRIELKHVAEILNGYPFDSNLFDKANGFPLIRIRDIMNHKTDSYYTGDYDKQYVIHKGDLLIGMDGDYNRERWQGPPALLNQRVCKLTIKSEYYHPDLLYYALPGYLKAINDKTSSVTVKHLSSRSIADIPLPLPPLPEQHRIVARIESLFQEVKAARQNLERVQPIIKKFRQSVLASAFRGELVPQNPGDEPASVLLERIQKERKKALGKKYKEPESVEGLAGLPEGWEWSDVVSLCEQIFVGIVVRPASYYVNSGVPALRNLNIKENYFDLDDIKYISEKDNDTILSKTKLKKNDILIVRSGNPGTASVVNEEIEGFNCIDLVVARPSSNLVNSDYISRFLNSPLGKEQVDKNARGIAQKHFNVKMTREVVIPIPPLLEQHRIVAKIEQLFALADQAELALENARKRADRMEQAILGKAFRGKLVGRETGVLLERIRKERENGSAKKQKQSK